MKVINTEKAPGAIGPYSQGFVVGNLVITSGQIPVNPADGSVGEGIAAQAEQSCKNVGAILEAAGSSFDKVVKTTCFLADMGDFAAFNEVYASTSPPSPPAAAWPSRPCPRTSCARSRLPLSCKRRLSIPIKKSKKRCCVLQQRFLFYS